MKFTSDKLKHIVLIALVCITNLNWGQTSTNSPFSYFGIGEQVGLDHSVFGALGNATAANFDSTVLNYYNPASYNSLSRYTPLMSLGISSRVGVYKENQSNNTISSVALQHFAMAFPISIGKKNYKHDLGLAFGIKPYAAKGYLMFSDAAIGTDTMIYEYQGKGNTSEVFLGLSTDLIHFQNVRLSVGGNIGYIFGGTTNYRRAYYKSDANDTIYETTVPGGVERKEIRLNSLHYDFGAYFSHRLNEHHGYTLGFTIEPYQDFNATVSNGLFYSSNVYDLDSLSASTSSALQIDTISYYRDSSGIISNIPTINVGLKYDFRFTLPGDRMNKMESLLSVHLGYRMANSSTFNNSFETNDSIPVYLNSSTFSLGLQYIPAVVERRVSNVSYGKRMSYRLGVYSSKLPYSINGAQLTDFGTTFGIGLPFKRNDAPISMLNLGFSIGKRGNGNDTNLNEMYYGFNFGVNIAPSFDLWFKKQKLN